MVNLIQKYNISKFVTTYMCMYISLTNATASRHDIQIDTVRTQNTIIPKIRMYTAECLMPRTSEAPFALVDIVRCSKSRITIAHHSPTNGSPGRRRHLDVPQAITEKKDVRGRAVADCSPKT